MPPQASLIAAKTVLLICKGYPSTLPCYSFETFELGHRGLILSFLSQLKLGREKESCRNCPKAYEPPALQFQLRFLSWRH